jgi:hypothetical protein
MLHKRWLLAAMLIVIGWSEAQGATHDLSVTLPDVVGIRVVGGGSGARDVVFDYASNPGSYLVAVHGYSVLLPTGVSRFTDVQVNATRNGRWNVEAVASPLTYVGPGSGSGLNLADIRVVRGVRSGLVQNAISGSGNSAGYVTEWRLSTDPQRIAFSRGSSGGWRSLGFNGWDYELTVDGNEDPGAYTTVVTYLLTAP